MTEFIMNCVDNLCCTSKFWKIALISKSVNFMKRF